MQVDLVKGKRLITPSLIGLFGLLSKRDGDQGPHPHRFLGRLSDRLLSGVKNSEKDGILRSMILFLSSPGGYCLALRIALIPRR
jgi:hypothetical protein